MQRDLEFGVLSFSIVADSWISCLPTSSTSLPWEVECSLSQTSLQLGGWSSELFLVHETKGKVCWEILAKLLFS